MNDWMKYEPTLWERIWWPVERKLKYLRYDVPLGFRGLWYWLSFAWRWRSWDACFGYMAMEHHLAAVQKTLETNQRHTGWERDVHNIKVTRELLRRSLELDCIGRLCKEDGLNAHQAMWGEQDNWRHLHTMLRKHARRWWD
jgi:hypothetical protein